MTTDIHLVFPIPYPDLIDAYAEGFDDHDEAEGRIVREEILDDLISINEMKIYYADRPILESDFVGVVITVPNGLSPNLDPEIQEGLMSPQEADQAEAAQALIKRRTDWTYTAHGGESTGH